ncbi:hypothetical protein Tco_0468057 [Tanacetum coccineum]
MGEIGVRSVRELCSKEKGGHGVGRLDLGFIKAIHGEDGKKCSGFKVGYKSIWRSILQEVETLKIKGIHLNNFMQKKLGNGADTYFWEDLWHGEGARECVRGETKISRLYALKWKKTVDLASKLSQENLTWSFRSCTLEAEWTNPLKD